MRFIYNIFIYIYIYRHNTSIYIFYIVVDMYVNMLTIKLTQC